jgi:arsenate reductase
MAEGFLNSLYGDVYEAYSAGTEPSRVHPYAAEVMKEDGIDIFNHRSKGVEEFKDKDFDFVITVCDQAKESCPFFPGGIIIHKAFKDPSQVSGSKDEILAEFRKSRDEIKKWIGETFRKKGTFPG